MTRDSAIVDYRDGWLCVRYTDTEFFEPIRYSHYWPVRRIPRDEATNIIGKQAVHAGVGAYCAKTDDRPGCGFWVQLPLLNGGQTMPIVTEREPIPCPKVRKGIETRYERGRWEKHLKTGWTVA